MAKKQLDHLKILKEFKKQETQLNNIHISDGAVRLVMASWANIKVDMMPPIGRPPADNWERWEWLWSQTRFDIYELSNATGMDERVTTAFSKARCNRLIYPDGTISSAATKTLMTWIRLDQEGMIKKRR